MGNYFKDVESNKMSFESLRSSVVFQMKTSELYDKATFREGKDLNNNALFRGALSYIREVSSKNTDV